MYVTYIYIFYSQQTLALVVPVAVIRPILDPQIFGDLIALSAALTAPGIKIQSYPPFVSEIFLPSAP